MYPIHTIWLYQATHPIALCAVCAFQFFGAYVFVIAAAAAASAVAFTTTTAVRWAYIFIHKRHVYCYSEKNTHLQCEHWFQIDAHACGASVFTFFVYLSHCVVRAVDTHFSAVNIRNTHTAYEPRTLCISIFVHTACIKADYRCVVHVVSFTAHIHAYARSLSGA